MIARIQKIIHHRKLTSSAFADKIGVPRSTISHIISGRNNPSLEFIQKVLDNFPEIRTEWLVRGEGQMLKASNTLFPEEIFEPTGSTSASGIDFGFDKKIRSEPAPQPEPETISVSAGALPDQAETKKSLKDSEEVKGNVYFDEKPVSIGNKTDKAGQNFDKKLKNTVRVLLFYNDGSFSEHYQTEQ